MNSPQQESEIKDGRDDTDLENKDLILGLTAVLTKLQTINEYLQKIIEERKTPSKMKDKES